MILKEVLDKSITFFKQRKFETPRLDAELLMAYGLGLERIQLYLKYDLPLKEHEITKLRELVVRRSQGEPIAYILGKKDFYKSTFLVNSHVLIPRPETETLVETAAKLLAKACKDLEDLELTKQTLEKESALSVLELGAGSGCISISLAKEFESVCFFAVEKSDGAFAVLEENLKNNPCENLKIIHQDAENEKEVVAACKETKEQFDLILSNPPYIDKEDENIDVNVKKYEPELALFADQKGLYFIESWIAKYSPYLKPNGYFLFEIGHTQGSELKNKMLGLNLFSEVDTLKDLSGKERILFLKKKWNKNG